MSESKIKNTSTLELPEVNWPDRDSNPKKFYKDLSYALSEFGFMVLTNAPGFSDDFQQNAFHEVRGFFESSRELKKTAYIAKTPYFRGYSLPNPAVGNFGQVIEAFQYGFEQEPICDYDDKTQPIHRRLFRGPNTWPDAKAFPGFKPLIDDLNGRYHRLTHLLGEAIVESLGQDVSAFHEYFDFDDPDLAASLNHNYSLSAYAEEDKDKIINEYQKFKSNKVGAHIDGPPFIALLINDRPGLQVVAADGQWIDAPVTCRTMPGEYHVPVIPGSVIVNTGGTLMHLSEGKYSATLHRVNTTLIPEGETRISMPYFLIPKMEGDLIPFGKFKADNLGAAGYEQGRDRGANASVNRMGTFPQVTKRWWAEEYAELKQKHRDEVEAETNAAFKLAKERGERFKNELN